MKKIALSCRYVAICGGTPEGNTQLFWSLLVDFIKLKVMTDSEMRKEIWEEIKYWLG